MDLQNKFESIISFAGKLDKSETVGLIFGLIFFLISIFAWYWICFLNGAQIWSNGISNYYRKIGLAKIGHLSFFSPVALKIIATVYIFSVITAAILVGITIIS